MVFEKIAKDITYNTYPGDKEKISMHIQFNTDLLNDLNKIIATYKDYGYDNTNRTELLGLLAWEFINNLTDETGSVLELMARLKDYRERRSL